MAIPSAPQFFAAMASIMETYHAGGPAGALEDLMTLVDGSDWRSTVDQRVPGASEQMEKDAATFFESDWPALRAWQFGAGDARKIGQPVLHIGGSDSGMFFAEVRELIRAWLPQTEDVVLTGANHSLAITHPADVTAALVAFFQRHAINALSTRRIVRRTGTT
ncbi:hypothetical protein BH23CHL1_BH23CHL1_20440 [soil metagenome]